ncbi:venom allergen-1-like [Maniola hyperantus]|uniref:venom allergen-1-like n=1 Tax=Aphantopus hyperantus TaxID=2795564 RepID=UPI00374A3A15
MLKILLLLGLSHTAALVDETPYCALRYRRLCQGKGRHVACRFPVPGPGLACQNYTQIKFTSELKNFIVHYINKRRQRIAAGNERVRGGVHLPRPEIMMLVSWDRELAKLAQRLADQCQFVHDECRATVRYPYAGQSVGEVRWRSGAEASGDVEGEAVSLGAQRTLRRVLDAWWGERRRVYARQVIAPFKLTTKDMVWGHFSQLAVWTLQAVGCGAVRHGFKHTKMLLVCDFSHTNMLGQRTITPGLLAPCPVHTARRLRTAYPLLCAPFKKATSSEKDDREIIKGYDYDEDIEEDEEGERLTLATRAIAKYRTTTQRTIDKFEQDIHLSSNEHVTLKKYHHWETRRPGFGRSYEDSENEDYAIFSKAKKKLIAHDDEDTKPEDEGKPFTRADGTANQGISRQRWKQTRMRPQRPGANALLNKPPEKQIQRSSMIPFVLDKDDSDQLFRDTGFNVNWRKQIQD